MQLYIFHTNMISYSTFHSLLTNKKLEIHCQVFSAKATDAQVLKHQAISIHSRD